MEKEQALPSILVVDDTVENLRLLGTLLGAHGLEVRPVTSGRLALQALEHAPPDLILLDVNMPEMSGFEVCERIRSMPGMNDVPVIFLTAQTDLNDKVKAFSVGGADYITKPFQIEEVLARVNAHLALRQARLDLRRNYEQLRELEQLRDDLVHMVVHDMRSPLTALLASLELLSEDCASVLPEQSAMDVRSAVAAAATLRGMTNDLLDVSRLENGKFPLALAPTELVAMAGELRAALGALDRSRDISIDAACPVTANCDAAVVRRVLENLVSNAIRHTPTGGRIRIRMASAEKQVRVSVEDEGRGVPHDSRSRIFQKFGNAAARRDKAVHSVGLGLAFCKLAIEAHGGTIGVTDADPVGSKFWFEIPA